MLFQGKYRKKNVLILLFAILLSAASPWQASAQDTATLPVKLVEQQTIGEGVELLIYDKKISGLNSRVFVTKVDLNNPYAEVRPLYGKGGTFAEKQTVQAMAEEHGAIAAINADFFNLKDRTPFGIVMDRGHLVSSMGRMPYWFSLGILTDRTAIIDTFTYQGKVTAPNGASFPIHGVNKQEYQANGATSHKDQIHLYTPAFGPVSLGLLQGYEDYVEVVVENSQVKEVREAKPAAAIPSTGYVLWGHGAGAKFLKENFKAGDAVVIESKTLGSQTSPDRILDSAMAGHVLLVDNGQHLNPTANSIKGKFSRSAVGISQDGKTLYLVAVEGPPNGRGMELGELSVVMKEIGSYRAFNLDGGGSTTMVARKLADEKITLLNTPTYITQRKVPTAIGVFNTAPQGEFENFIIQGPSQVLKGSEAEFTVKGYDEHYHPYRINTSEVTWSALDPMTGNRFLGLTTGAQEITAEYKGVRQTKTVQVIGAAQVNELMVEPSILSVSPGQSKTFAVKVKTKDGQILPVTPKGAVASVPESLGTVHEFTFTGGTQEGEGEMTVNFDGLEVKIPVSVGTVEQPFISFDTLSGLSYRGHPAEISSKGSFALTTGQDPFYRTNKAAKLVYNFKGAAPDEIRIAYGVLGNQPIALDGTPLEIGLWVHGDGSRHWLRAEIEDAQGKIHFMDLAKEIHWNGWQYVKGNVPAAVKYPIKLKSIYVVNMPEGTGQRPEQGTLYFDELTLYQPYGASKVLKPAHLTAGQAYQLAKDIRITVDAQAYLEPVSTVPLYMPTKNPVHHGFKISGEGAAPGKLTLSAANWPSDKDFGLLYMNLEKKVYEEVRGTRTASGEWVFPIQQWGTYFPYIEDVKIPFIDVRKGIWYEEAVVKLYHAGVIKGLTDRQFGPDVALTRAQFVTLLGRWLGWKEDPSIPLNFKDKIPDYAVPAVKAAVSKGIVQGFPDGTFKPDEPLTRAQMTVMLYRALAEERGLAPNTASIKPFKDDKAILEWAREAVYTMSSLGYIQGIDGSFVPNGTATRAQSAVLIHRLNQ